jgi:hypothetical protein
LHAFGDDPRLQAEIDWATGAFFQAPLVQSPTFCHGLAGQLELCRMLDVVPRHRTPARHRAARIAAVFRLLQQRRKGLIAWSSEDPDIFTPDLWIGFLGPATALAMSLTRGCDPLLSGPWLRRCSEVAQ